VDCSEYVAAVVVGHVGDNQSNLARFEEVMAVRSTGSNSQRTGDHAYGDLVSNAEEVRECDPAAFRLRPAPPR